MIVLLCLLIIVLLLLYLGFEIGQDVIFNRKKFFTFFEKPRLQTKIIYNIAILIFVLAIWVLLSYTNVVSSQFLPTPYATLSAFLESLVSGELIKNTLVSLYRVGIGFLLASIIGVLLGSIIGTFSRVEALLQPLNSAIRYIPPTAFIGLSIIWLGIGEVNKIALIFFAVIFYIIQMVADTVKLVPKVYIETAQILGATRREIFTRIILSSSIADILAVIRVNLGAAWTFLIVAELVSAQNGLGYLMSISQRFLQTPKLFALIFFVGFLGFLSDSLLARAIKYFSRWK